MTDHSKTRPVVDQAAKSLGSTWKAKKNSEEIKDFELGNYRYDDATGKGHIKGSGTTADGEYAVDITITPKGTDE